MTRLERLQQRLREYQEARTQHRANAHAAEGAIQAIEREIADERAAAELPPAEVVP